MKPFNDILISLCLLGYMVPVSQPTILISKTKPAIIKNVGDASLLVKGPFAYLIQKSL